MRVTEKAIQQLVQNLYSAAVVPEEWAAALDKMRGLFGSAAAGVFITNNLTGKIEIWSFRGTEAGEGEYLDHIKDLKSARPLFRHARARTHCMGLSLHRRARDGPTPLL